MVPFALIVVVCVASAGYLLRRKPAWRAPIALVGSVALLLPVTAPSSATPASVTASTRHAGHRDARPEILEARATPWELPAKGGWTTVLGQVRFASACHLVALGWRHGVLPSQYCSTGKFSEKLWLAPNKEHIAESQAFEFVATSAKGTAEGKFFARLAAAPLPLPPPTTTTAATTTSAPPVTSGASTGVIPFIPSGPSSPSETTTTTTAPTTTTTTAPTTTTTAPTTTTTPTTTSTTPASSTWQAPTSQSPNEVFSYNWSGYELSSSSQQQPISGVQSTFTVPYLTTDASCPEEQLSAWAGVDGVTNADTDLIQAGVGYNCTTNDQYVLLAWWEILPAAETFITAWNTGPLANQAAVVNPGDTVAVDIYEVSVGAWSITVTDETTGGSYATTPQPYSGPGTSAEWVMEAPYSSTACAGDGIGDNSGYCELAPYCMPSTTPGECSTSPTPFTLNEFSEVPSSGEGVVTPIYMDQYQDDYFESEPTAPYDFADNDFGLLYTGPDPMVGAAEAKALPLALVGSQHVYVDRTVQPGSSGETTFYRLSPSGVRTLSAPPTGTT